MRPSRSRWKVLTVASSADLVVADERDDDLARARIVLLAHDDDVAVEDAGLDHRFALDAEEEVGVAAERLGDRDLVLDRLLREQRAARSDLAEERELGSETVGRRCLSRFRPTSSIARGFVGSRRRRPARSRFARWAWTVDGEARPTASPISRTVGG